MRFKKGTQFFSRKLEKICNIQHIPDPEKALIWCRENGYSTVAIEITENPIFIDEFIFPQRTAIIVGNEGVGLEKEIFKRVGLAAKYEIMGNMLSIQCEK